MVIPSSGFGEDVDAVPSDYVLKRRGIMIALLTLEGLTSATRFFDFGVPHTVDTVGGIFCLVGVVIGRAGFSRTIHVVDGLYFMFLSTCEGNM